MRSQGRKSNPVNSVYFGRFIPTDEGSELYAYIPSSKFLDDNALHYTELDQFNLSPLYEGVPERIPTVSASSIAAVCSTRKDVVRFVLREIIDTIPKLLAQLPAGKLQLNIGLGLLIISSKTLHF